ncbi:MAG TPA: hypothetical protein VK196_17345 [Magnetospirillum sp.]|nr:hypothetical protein [Magnetospirillum sp.]
MTEPDAPRPAGPQACEAIANTMIGHFATRLEVEARRAGGMLSAEAIRELAARFMAEEAVRFQPALQRSWDSCTKARETLQWESARRNPFDRILAKPFAHLFPPRQGDDGGQGVLSRRMLPGFHLAIDKMIGPALFEQCQRKAQAILDRHRHGGGYDWTAIHADGEARDLCADVLVVVAHYFANFERRREWFMALVNSNLARVPAGATDACWQLTEHGFSELMRALFAELAARMAADADGLQRRYGDQTLAVVQAFFRRLRA